MKKIAIIYSGSKFGGGVDTYYSQLLKNYKKEEVAIVIFSLGHWRFLNTIKETEYKLFSGARFNPLTILAIAKTLMIEGYSLVVTNGVVSNAYGRAAALLSGKPVLTVVHSEHNLDYPNSFLRILYSFIEKVTRWKTKRYIAVSEYLKKELEKSGIKSKKISVIFNAVTPLPIIKKKSNKQIIVGSIGRLHPVKNNAALLLAASDLPDDVKVKIAGEGDERRKLESIIAENKLEKKVELLGYVKDIPGFLSCVDVYVQASFSEGFGLTVIEAMQAGIPVVVTPAGALPEIVTDGKTGIVTGGFEPKDLAEAINKLIQNKKLREELAREGQKAATENFKPVLWAESTVKAYLETK